MNEGLVGWKRMLYAFAMQWAVYFLTSFVALEAKDISIATIWPVAWSAVAAAIPVVISFLNSSVKQYGYVGDGEWKI